MKYRDKTFELKLNSVMIDNQYDRVVPRRKRGKLDTKSLWRVSTGQEDVFKQKQEKKGKKYNIVLLVDESGSMYLSGRRDRIIKAADITLMLMRSFKNLNIDFAVVGFNSEIVTHKDFSDKGFNTVSEYDNLKQEMIDLADEQKNHDIVGCNHDYDAIKEALGMLKGKEGQNILMVISDGNPNCDIGTTCRSRNKYDQSKHQFDKIRTLLEEKPKGTLAVGIGIESYAVEKIYPDHILVEDTDQLKVEVLKYLRKNIKRG